MLHFAGTTTLAILTVVSTMAAVPAVAADMLVYDQQPVRQEYRPVRAAAYVQERPLHCGDLIVEYRAPLYPPRTEIVRICRDPS